MKYLLPILVILLCFTCKQSEDKLIYPVEKSAIVDTAMVVSAHPLASQVGKDILFEGGNAIDAIIGIQFALAVVYPRAGNIGGGGFLVYRDKDGNKTSLDYREKAPKSAHRDMYLDGEGNVIDGLSRAGHLAVGVPGTVDGLIKAHQKYGKIKDFKRLIQPAIDLAKNGFKVTKSEVTRLNNFKPEFEKHNSNPTPFIKNTTHLTMLFL